MTKKRCDWADPNKPDYVAYHDNEWGRPVYDDKTLFEFLVLESAQAGLNWYTILKRREGYRAAFANYDVNKVAKYNQKKVETLLDNPKIIRNRAKIEAAINNAKIFITIQKEYGSFSNFLWGFINHKPIVSHFDSLKAVPANTQLSDKISSDLKRRGFRFFGTTICYAYLQACGLVQDHTTDCFCYTGKPIV